MTEQVKADGEPLIRILHPSDFSKSSRVAFAHALKIALQSKAELELVHVQRHNIGSQKDVHWTDFPGVRATLERWKILPSGAKRGLSRWLHKAVAEPLARRSRAMTLFVPESASGFISPADGAVSLRRILVPVDHAPSAQAALEEAYFLASGFDRHGVVFKLLHAGTDKGMPTLYLPHRPGWRWEESLVPGDPVECILKEAAGWSPDLIVMATQGHMDFLDALRGSTTERVLRGVHCPVLAVPEKPA